MPKDADQLSAIANVPVVACRYLKAIYNLGEHDPTAVSTGGVAERLGVHASSVSGMLRKLSAMGLVDHERYGHITLTDRGLAIALQVVRRHRLLEMYLVAELGYTWDEVHTEAESLELMVSEQLLDRLDNKLNRPSVDPHGDPIPGPDGHLPVPTGRRLPTLQHGEGGQISRVDDSDPDVLRYLAVNDIKLGDTVELRGQEPFEGPFILGVNGHEQRLSRVLAQAIWISVTSEAGALDA